MQFTFAAVAAVLASAVSAHGYGYSNTTSAVWVTDIVTAYTTYCPYATQLTLGGKTYNIEHATTLTITGGVYTVSKPVYVTPVVYCSSCSVKPVYSNSTVTHGPTAPAPAGTAAPTGAAPQSPAFHGAANKAVAGVGGAAAMAVLAVLAL